MLRAVRTTRATARSASIPPRTANGHPASAPAARRIPPPLSRAEMKTGISHSSAVRTKTYGVNAAIMHIRKRQQITCEFEHQPC